MQPIDVKQLKKKKNTALILYERFKLIFKKWWRFKKFTKYRENSEDIGIQLVLEKCVKNTFKKIR